MGWFDKLSKSMTKSRDKLNESLNVILDRGIDLDDDFWDDLTETLIMADMGGSASMEIVDNIQDYSTKKAMTKLREVNKVLVDEISNIFVPDENHIFELDEVCVLFVGVNGAGKTTTVGKTAKNAHDAGKKVLIGSADTFRAAAIEQLDVWGKRANVEVIKRERGADPASVCYDVLDSAEKNGDTYVLIDTAGRLHTSKDLMRELQKVVEVTKKRSTLPVYTVLVIDSTTGQNGLSQAREFNESLGLDGVIMTKLDGTARGGIAVAVSHELNLPILRIGVGESIEDLRPFDSYDYARALLGVDEVGDPID